MASIRAAVRVFMVVSFWGHANKAKHNRPQSMILLHALEFLVISDPRWQAHRYCPRLPLISRICLRRIGYAIDRLRHGCARIRFADMLQLLTTARGPSRRGITLLGGGL